MARPVSARFKAAIVRGHKRTVRVDVMRPNGVFVGELHVVTDGSVTVDETQPIRRTATLTVDVRGAKYDKVAGEPDYVPRKLGDLLHPATGNEVHIYRGVDYQDGSDPEEVRMGIFRMTKPVAEDDVAKADQAKVEITLTLQDRSAWISRLSWIQPYDIPPGTTLRDAIYYAIESRISGVFQYRIDPAAYVYLVGRTVWGVNMASANDPWKDMTRLATSAGFELFFDADGVVVLRPVQDPTKVVAEVTPFIEGVNCTMEKVTLTLDETNEYNGVIVVARGKGKDVLPVRVEVWDDDPKSPTYYLGDWGKSPYKYITHAFPYPGQTHDDAVAQAMLVGQAQLQRVLQSMDQISLEAIPDPSIEEGDAFRVQRRMVNVASDYTASTITFPLNTTDNMVITNRPRRKV